MITGVVPCYSPVDRGSIWEERFLLLLLSRSGARWWVEGIREEARVVGVGVVVEQEGGVGVSDSAITSR